MLTSTNATESEQMIVRTPPEWYCPAAWSHEVSKGLAGRSLARSQTPARAYHQFPLCCIMLSVFGWYFLRLFGSRMGARSWAWSGRGLMALVGTSVSGRGFHRLVRHIVYWDRMRRSPSQELFLVKNRKRSDPGRILITERCGRSLPLICHLVTTVDLIEASVP